MAECIVSYFQLNVSELQTDDKDNVFTSSNDIIDEQEHNIDTLEGSAAGNESTANDRFNTVDSEVSAFEENTDSQYALWYKQLAAFSLGIIGPCDLPVSTGDMQDSKLWIDKMIEHASEINNKIEFWSQYGKITAITYVKNGNDRLQFFWIITDKGVVILSSVIANNSTPGVLCDLWWIGDNGIRTDYKSGLKLSEQEFADLKPSFLVIDESIREIYFSSFHNAYYPSVIHEYQNLCWVRKLIFNPATRFIPFDYSLKSYDSEDAQISDCNSIDCKKCSGVQLFKDSLVIESCDSQEFPYYISDNIIYEKGTNNEIICFNSNENKRRYEASKLRIIEKIKARNRKNDLCQHCGGSFTGLLIKKCEKCGRKKDY